VRGDDPLHYICLMRLEKLLCGISLIAAVSSVACSNNTPAPVVQTEHAPPVLASVVRMNDPKASAQLVSGFYAVENNTWRWTAQKFSVHLPTPTGGAQKGGTLMMSFTVLDSMIHQLKDITLTATIGPVVLKSEKYDVGGAYVFSADVPATLLSAESTQVNFTLDKSIRPPGDGRDLGVIATFVALADK
jgi:hypothetical protein